MSLEVALAENTKALNNLAELLQEIAKGPAALTVAGSAPKYDSQPVDVTKLNSAEKDFAKSAPPAADPPKETVSAAPPSAEPSDPAQADAEPEVTPADLRKQVSAEVVRLCKAGTEPKKQAAAVLKEFGAAQVPQIKDADLAAALAKLKAL